MTNEDGQGDNDLLLIFLSRHTIFSQIKFLEMRLPFPFSRKQQIYFLFPILIAYLKLNLANLEDQLQEQ